LSSVQHQSSVSLNAASEIIVTPGPTINLDALSGDIAQWTAGENETVNIRGIQLLGQRLVFFITNDGILPRVITFGNGFKASGVLTGVLSKTTVLEFMSNEIAFHELYRSVGL
jgi:hypothetical protein